VSCTGSERLAAEVTVRNETGKLEQAAPHEPSHANEVEQRVLREHGPALALPAFQHLVENRRGQGYDDQARDEAREERVMQPELVVGEVPHDRTAKDEHTEGADDPRRARVLLSRVAAAWPDRSAEPAQCPPLMLGCTLLVPYARTASLSSSCQQNDPKAAAP
jgi:hypothetical protein